MPSTTPTATPTASPPVFDVDETQSRDAYVGVTFHYCVFAKGDAPITYSIVKGPPGMTIDPASGHIKWTPTAGDEGDHEVTVQAINAAGTDEYTFTVKVHASGVKPYRLHLPLVAGKPPEN